MRALKWFEARERWNLPRHQSIPDNFQARKPRRNETPEDQPMNFNQSSPSITASTPNVCLHLAIRTPAYVNEGRKRIRAAEIQSPPPFFFGLSFSPLVWRLGLTFSGYLYFHTFLLRFLYPASFYSSLTYAQEILSGDPHDLFSSFTYHIIEPLIPPSTALKRRNP